MILIYIFSTLLVTSVRNEIVTTRMSYDSMSQLAGQSSYPENWYNWNLNISNKFSIVKLFKRWNERQECFNRISPGLIDTLDLAWKVLAAHLTLNI